MSDASIRMLPCTAYNNTPEERYDLVVQFDGLTEMGRSLAQNYMDRFGKWADLFLSINHDYNEYRVLDLYKENPHIRVRERFPSWYRDGYVEELLRWV
jgi:hypothetical protein